MNDSPATARVTTVRTAVERLGGTNATAALLPGYSPQSISNAIARNYFPPVTYVILNDALRAIGIAAPPQLWRMLVPPKRRTSSR